MTDSTNSAAAVALQVLEAIRATNPELIADNMPSDWGMNKLREALKVQKLNPMVHGFKGKPPREVYDQTQTDDSIKDGDVLNLGNGNVAILMEAWPTIVFGEIEGFHQLAPGETFESIDGGKYAASAAKARELLDGIERPATDQAALADKAFEDYDFGEGVMVTDTSGWEYTSPGHERTRKVYVETRREDDGPAPRSTLNFTVRFDPATGTLEDACATDENGSKWGSMASASDLGSYVIYSPNESACSSDGAGFWSNDFGWTTLDQATRFSEQEKQVFDLPMSTGADAAWADWDKANASYGAPAPGTVKVRLTLNITYDLNGENAVEMVSRLRKMCERAIGDGMLTGETDAEVEEYSMDVVIPPEPLSEEEIADFMRRRIENSQIDPEDIPIRLARYGLMERDAFIDEMRERMESAANDQDA